MADALNVKKISAFADNTAPADTDCFLTATGDVAKKTTVAQAKRIVWRQFRTEIIGSHNSQI